MPVWRPSMAKRDAHVFGQVDWDGPDGNNEHVRLKAAYDQRSALLRNRLVRINDWQTGCDYLGRISDGPFFPAPLTNPLEAPNVGPREVFGQIEVQGELVAGRVNDTNTRPAPGSTVLTLDDTDVAELIGCTGDMVLGTL